MNKQHECFIREITKLVVDFTAVLDVCEVVGVLELLKMRLFTEVRSAAKSAEPVPQQTTRKGTPQKRNCRK
jgi:hypothetical protein